MRTIKNQNLAQLLMQLRFTPQEKRRRELEAAEKLFSLIDANKQYPFDFVCFHITGFHSKGSLDHELIPGGDLLEDLEQFISRLSRKLPTPADAQKEKVHTVEDLIERFKVSAKTIQRWRKKGLLVRKFIFEDGSHRLGFLGSVVESFVQNNPKLVAKPHPFRRLTAKQRQQIVRQARSLASKTSLSRHRIIEQISKDFDVAHETVRSTLQNYEEQHPNDPVFQRPPGRMRPNEAAELFRLHKQGLGPRELMKRFDRSRSTIYRIVHQRRALSLLARKIQFVANPEFEAERAKEPVRSVPARASVETSHGVTTNQVEPFEFVEEDFSAGSTSQALLPEYLQILKTTPVLNRDQEAELFRRYNFLKYLVATERHQLKLANVSAALLSQLEGFLEEAEEIRKTLVEANLRLVVSIASKHTSGGANFLELVSKGNLALIQAVEEYDFASGIRFSRLAALKIAKEYAKVSGRSTELTRKQAESIATIQRGLRQTTTDVLAIERARQDLAQVIRDELDEREQHVILHHFGLLGTSIRKNTKTLKQIGDELGLTKERIRQIELTALQKLRQCLSQEQFELLTG
jgi:RNA polymerase sigma factor (sigma-70 family)